MGSINTFRWELNRPEYLGRLLHGESAPAYEGFIPDLRYCCAKIVAMSRDADIVFLGRSPESLFDYLSAITRGTSREARIQLLNISLRGHSLSRIRKNYPHAYEAIKSQFCTLGLDPLSLMHRKRPVLFADVVASGDTFGRLFTLISFWSRSAVTDYPAVMRKIRFLGITVKDRSSPDAWRWWQHKDWVKKLPAASIKNISVPWEFWDYIGNHQKKTQQCNRPECWSQEKLHKPSRNSERLMSLRLAYHLYQHAVAHKEKIKFAAEIAKTNGLKQRWLRKFQLELKYGESRLAGK